MHKHHTECVEFLPVLKILIIHFGVLFQGIYFIYFKGREKGRDRGENFLPKWPPMAVAGPGKGGAWELHLGFLCYGLVS